MGSESTTLTWGGQTLLEGSAQEFVGSRIAQNGVNYDNIMGTLTLSGGGGGLLCDLDADGDCDPSDIDILYASSPTQTDISDWLTQASDPTNPYKTESGGTVSDSYVLGDVNLDGDVNSTDLGQLLNNFNSTDGALWGGGDVNTDNNVNSVDLGLLLNKFNFTSASSVAVPEPANMTFAFLAFIVAVGMKRRHRFAG